tara:strand:+ start:813 stop:989 length:177 start_codon:yes stop_codon:yes gene_type:complete
MFIKFSDKTKKIMVKNSKKDLADGYLEEDSLFLDDDSEKNRRVRALTEPRDDDFEDKN